MQQQPPPTPPPKPKANNYAFIDSQNVNLGVRSLDWRLSWKRFRQYLARRYDVTTAYLFLGFVSENQDLYRSLQKAGYVLVFKEVTYRQDGKPKGNVDAELVLQAMIDYPQYDQAVIVTSDGDFACLVRHLRQQNKLRIVLSPKREHCSALLKKAAQGYIRYLDQVRDHIEHRK